MIDPRWYGVIELGLVFGAILGWAGWQWWGWRRWRRDQQRRASGKGDGDAPP
ncbi:hypothetical protein [Pelomonas cellulosilytica]|uniref:Uncharacterized protein n=1 Tax=Pelomonas cellulosilytica TaxID=2906762 RepID=A0ABS8XT68_9BURK|nr:hypothetical protein [Pelomonas sp. P8]MCE4554388.1 hypothetical protein [Pelomonas sp. P8]